MSNPLPSWRSPDAPAPVAGEMAALRAALDRQIPPKRDAGRNLLIGTWNVRAFASLTEKWTAGDNDSPKRDWRGLWAIAEIISRFDVVAVQEVKGDLRALRTLMKTLGPKWSFLMTDVTRGSAGASERLAFVFDASRVALSGLAGELVVPEEELQDLAPDALQRQFARTPYAVSFRAGRQTFTLVTLHVLFGQAADERVPELKKIARWLGDWAREMDSYGQNLIALGDFNIDRHGDALWRAFTSTGLAAPAELNQVRRTIFDEAGDDVLENFYDQIAWFGEGAQQKLNLSYVTGGGFDFVPHLYRDQGLSNVSLSFRVSDHYPLWVEFAE